jgi:hypothetical protein
MLLLIDGSAHISILLFYIFLNTDSCTQNSIDFYLFVTIGLVVSILLLLFLELFCLFNLVSKNKNFLILKILIIIIAVVQAMPYFIYTTIKGITICQGSLEWGGFANKYNFEYLPLIIDPVERYLPIIYILVPIILFALLLMGRAVRLRREREPGNQGDCLGNGIL